MTTTEPTTTACTVCGEQSTEDPCSPECDENLPCPHYESEWGNCVACGADTTPTPDEVAEMGAYLHRVTTTGCAGRGQYHDGSEDWDALREGREKRPCPSCGGK